MHKTMPILTKYEKTKILGMRVKQLNSGANQYVTTNEKIIDNYLIAQMELEQKKLPFIIQRPLPNNNFEYWKLQDLDLL
jgi:DNA-directed RNA polymerase I, II, and III subunit RPABC2